MRVLAKAKITTPTPIQSLAIADALAGRDICGKARTGSGKTLAFGLPIMERALRGASRRPASLILVPTRELANQIADALEPLAIANGVSLTTVYGGMSINRQAQILRSGVDLVIATPGRLNDLIERNDVSVADVKVAVLDEADQMADLGFLPQVERILNRIEGERQTLLFSATLDGDIDRLVRRYQREPVFHEVATSEETVPTMTHRFVGVEPEEKVSVAAAIAAGPERTLFFVRTQRGAERLARLLHREGVAAGALHGGLSQPQRERALRAFANGRVPVLVATNIAARGIHVDGVDIVVHHDPPEDTKTYLHRSGRTARAGASGLVVTLVEPEQLRDVNMLRRDAGVREVVVPMRPDDQRLADLAGWEPPTETHAPRPKRSAGNRSGGSYWRSNRPRGRRAGAPAGHRNHSDGGPAFDRPADRQARRSRGAPGNRPPRAAARG
ncbi:MAG: DEAD/DEAH box helicase [Dehalococcoidia bacterium]|nr:DEAD/DEAH box helicase [Dehalococcoidia bacterium]